MSLSGLEDLTLGRTLDMGRHLGRLSCTVRLHCGETEGRLEAPLPGVWGVWGVWGVLRGRECGECGPHRCLLLARLGRCLAPLWPHGLEAATISRDAAPASGPQLASQYSIV